jgi:hypothetical protein
MISSLPTISPGLYNDISALFRIVAEGHLLLNAGGITRLMKKMFIETNLKSWYLLPV